MKNLYNTTEGVRFDVKVDIGFEANNVTVKVKFSVFRTICGFNFIPWGKGNIFLYGVFFAEGEGDL
jgi:hypothetical protein